MKTICALALGVLALPGCAGQEPPRWNHYMGSAHLTVAVLKPVDSGAIVDDADLEATQDRITGELVHRGFTVLPKETVEAFYQKKGIGIRAEMNTRYKGRIDELGKELGVDAVLYTNVTEWGKEIAGVVNNLQVKIEFFLMDGKEKDKTIWKNFGEKKVDLNAMPTTNTKSLGQSIFGAVAGTVLSSPSDLMPEVVVGAFSTLGHAGYKK